MKLGILSDTHNHTQNLQRALSIFRQREVNRLIHCGDVTQPTTAELLRYFHVTAVTGNMDQQTALLKRTLLNLNPENSLADVLTEEIDGVAVAATHGHMAGKLQDLVENGRFAFIFHGHTHRRRDDLVNGARIINPGALGGARHESRSICIVDLATNEIEFIEIGPW